MPNISTNGQTNVVTNADGTITITVVQSVKSYDLRDSFASGPVLIILAVGIIAAVIMYKAAKR